MMRLAELLIENELMPPKAVAMTLGKVIRGMDHPKPRLTKSMLNDLLKKHHLKPGTIDVNYRNEKPHAYCLDVYSADDVDGPSFVAGLKKAFSGVRSDLITYS